MTDAAPVSDPHPLWEDALAIATGCLVVSLGVVFYAKATLLVGGSSGMALLLHYTTGWPFWAAFSAVNLPFYALAWLRMGVAFTLRTFAAVTLVSALARFSVDWVSLASVAPLYASVAGGVLIGVGLLILFRHRTGLGGVNVLAMYLQERLGWRAGWTQLGIDLTILAVAAFVLPPERLALSVLGAVVVNAILAVNHKPGRYTGYS
jgi:uncharacterized membrane-anchored protein YitT (DUF2179 family)